VVNYNTNNNINYPSPTGEGAVNPLHPFPLGGNRKGGRVKEVEIDDNQIIILIIILTGA